MRIAQHQVQQILKKRQIKIRAVGHMAQQSKKRALKNEKQRKKKLRIRKT